jgi:hypothetical protein
MVVVLALAAAAAFALGTVLQQKGTLDDARRPGARSDAEGVGFLVRLLRSPVWLLGAAVTAVGGVLQAVALHFGSLTGVQALSTSSLVMALPFGVWLTGQVITRAVWLGAVSVLTGILLFVVVGSPQGGDASATAAEWWTAGLATAGLVVVLAWAGRRRTGSRRAVAFGAGAGLGFGLATALTKTVTDQLVQGLGVVLGNWQVYALLAAGLVGLFLGQSSLRTGALASAMAATNSVMLLSSIWLGVTVFDERFQRGGGALIVVLAGLALMLAGVHRLAAAPLPRPADNVAPTSGMPA